MPTTPLVIRAAPTALVRVGPYAVIVGVLGLILATLRAAFGSPRYENSGIGWWAIPAIGALLGLPLLALAVALWLRRRNLRIVLDDATLTVRDQYGRSASWPREEIKVLWHVPLRTNQEQGAVILLLGEGKRVLATLWHKTWDLDRLAPLANALGVTIEASALPREAEGLTVADARRRYPGIEIPVSFVHPLALGCLGGLTVMAYAAAWVAMMVMLSG
jgi:hypothetical protein